MSTRPIGFGDYCVPRCDDTAPPALVVDVHNDWAVVAVKFEDARGDGVLEVAMPLAELRRVPCPCARP